MAKEALKIADKEKDDEVKVAGIHALGFLDALRGKLQGSESKAVQMIQISKNTNQLDYEALGCLWQNLILSWRGQFEEAYVFSQQGIKAAETDRSSTFVLVQVRWSNALALIGSGNYNEALIQLKESIGFCERMGEKVNQSRQWNTIGWIYNDLYDWDHANDYNQKGLELATPIGDSEIILNAKINLADSAFGIGELDKARDLLNDIYTSMPSQHEWMKWRITQRLTHSLGEVLLNEGDLDRALSLADECLALAEPSDSRKNIVKGRRLRGEVFHKQGEFMEAEKEFSKALAIAQEIGNPPQLWKTYIALGDLQHDLKKKDKALQAYHNAVLVIDKVAKELNDQMLKATFLNSEHVQSIIKKAGK
jgi:tetratricopeptide (TPR) repeat protein